MLYKTINILNLSIVAVFAGILGQYVGPRNLLPNPALVNGTYFEIMKLHFIFLGAFSCFVLFAVGKLLKASYTLITTSLLLAALFNVYLMHASDQGFPNINFGEVLEILLPFLLGGMGMLVCISLLHLLWARFKSKAAT